MLHDDPVIHPRISRRHPEIEVEDVAAAWENSRILRTISLDKNPDLICQNALICNELE